MSDNLRWHPAYDRAHASLPSHRRRPVIGITGNYGEKGCELAEGYYRSVLAAGGTPLVIPAHEETDALVETLLSLDGLLLSGGGDINPLLLGEEPSPRLHQICPQRDKGELLLTSLAYDFQLPMLGICRGAQTLAAALGGTIHQDLEEACEKGLLTEGSQGGDPEGTPLLKHSQDEPREYPSHTVSIEGGTLLSTILGGKGEVAVNSFHHQAVREAGPHLRVSARARDGVVEAVESSEHKSILGVQWHPECFVLRGDRSMLPLFAWLVEEARSYRQAIDIHERIITLDSHTDTPMKWAAHEEPLVTLPKMRLGHLDAAVVVAYLPQGDRDEDTLLATTAKAERILNEIEERVARQCTLVDIARTPEDVLRLKREGKAALLLGIENGYAIGRDVSLVEHFRRRGVVYMTLCHNGDNDLCDSARGHGEHGGLSPLGREAIREMNRTGMMIDLSHAAETTFWQTLDESTSPVVCSHSCCRSLCPHPRNLTDAQMQALAHKGGVMQVTLYEGFLREGGGATIEDVVEHVNHAVSVMGIEHVGIGSDFDGDGGVPGVADASEVINLTRRLLRERYGERELRLLWGGNFLRVMGECQRG